MDISDPIICYDMTPSLSSMRSKFLVVWDSADNLEFD